MRWRLAALRARATSREPAQILVLFALFALVLMVLAGSAYDYASIVVDDAKLQNAVDAAALAGSDTLSNNATLSYGTPAAVAQATTLAYLSANGVVAGSTPNTTVSVTFPTSTPMSGVPTPATPVLENISLQVTRDHPTAFWPLVGIPHVTMTDGGSAHAAHGLIDVMLVMDTTRSMVNSASIANEEAAVSGFVSSMNPNVGDPRSPRIALARFQGVKNCTYTVLNVLISCQDDYTVLSGLTGNGLSLRELADGAGEAACVYPSPAYACPLNYYSSPPGGTKLPNAVNVVNNPSYIFSTANGGRNDNTVGGAGYAKKILIIMTDGEDTDSSGALVNQAPIWDALLGTSAATLKLGPDGVAGTQDDVEIYTVNYQWCDSSHLYPSSECMSQLAAYGAGNHECPTGTLLTTALANMSPSDRILYTASSSTANTCDHYFPLAKSESLPVLFAQLAGTISRGALTQ